MAGFKAGFKAKFKEIGVVEGFYGRVWQPEERRRFIEALCPFGLNTYLYCPKHESALAAGVMAALSTDETARLGGLAAFCRERGVDLWAGLHLEPPLNIADAGHIDAVAAKCLALWKLGFTGFCVQFDDLSCAYDPASAHGDSLAGLQGRGVSALFESAKKLGVGGQWMAVPALYSQDPILEKTYGPYEPAYLSLLDARMPPEVGWMYTGPRVCSPRITPADVLDWGKGSGRPVVLWDNYPVNDAAMVNNLHLAPLTGRDPKLPSVVRGYFFNPLLQADLGTLPGATCLAYAADPAGYDPLRAWNDALEAILPPEALQPFRELEALTRRCCLEEFPADDLFGDAGSLAARLEAGWLAMEDGRGGDSAAHRAGLSAHGGGLSVHVELERILGDLAAALPAAMLEQAQPWLERLRRAQQVFTARGAASARGSIVQDSVVQGSAAADWSDAVASYRQGEAWVLGQWFSP